MCHRTGGNRYSVAKKEWKTNSKEVFHKTTTIAVMEYKLSNATKSRTNVLQTETAHKCWFLSGTVNRLDLHISAFFINLRSFINTHGHLHKWESRLFRLSTQRYSPLRTIMIKRTMDGRSNQYIYGLNWGGSHWSQTHQLHYPSTPLWNPATLGWDLASDQLDRAVSSLAQQSFAIRRVSVDQNAQKSISAGHLKQTQLEQLSWFSKRPLHHGRGVRMEGRSGNLADVI